MSWYYSFDYAQESKLYCKSKQLNKYRCAQFIYVPQRYWAQTSVLHTRSHTCCSGFCRQGSRVEPHPDQWPSSHRTEPWPRQRSWPATWRRTPRSPQSPDNTGREKTRQRGVEIRQRDHITRRMWRRIVHTKNGPWIFSILYCAQVFIKKKALLLII